MECPAASLSASSQVHEAALQLATKMSELRQQSTVDFIRCPVGSTTALAQVRKAALHLARKISDLEPPGHAQANGQILKDEDSDESTLLGQGATIFFIGFVAYVVFIFVRIVLVESRRYRSCKAEYQGSFKQYVRYRFGHWYTWTPGSAGIVLLSMSLCLLVFGGLLLTLLTHHELSEGFWSAWLMIAAPDGGGGADTPVARMIGLIISVGGMLVFALLLSVISNTFEETLQSVRQGAEPVIEGDHTVILGYATPMLLVIVQELCEANESSGGTLIAILSPLPKPEVEDYLRECDGEVQNWKKNSTVVVRSGDASRAEDLAKVAVKMARKVVIMSKPGLSREESDAWTINVLLTLRNNKWPLEGHCVAQCQLSRNQRIFKTLLNETSQVLAPNDYIGELMVQCSKQDGLMSVVRSIFSFEGDEFYIQQIKGIGGRTFKDLLFALPDVILVGVMLPNGVLELVPSMERVCQDDDLLCVLAEDDSTVPTEADTSSTSRVMVGEHINQAQNCEHASDKIRQEQTIIICGWNDNIGAILLEIDSTVGVNSQVIIHTPYEIGDREQFIEASQKRRNHRYQNFLVHHQQGPLCARLMLEELPLEKASMVLILADDSFESPSMADRTTISVIVQVRDIIEERCGLNGSSVVVMPQILENANEETLMQTGLQNYVLSNRLAARMMAIVCEVPETTNIIDCLVKHRVCKFSITKLHDYPAAANFNLSMGVSFNDVTEIAALANEVVLGWSEIGGGDAGPWEMNPKSREEKRPWPDEARLVVLRRNDTVKGRQHS